VDLQSGDQRKPEFLALNPNGKVPTMVVSGTPMFEALAMIQWLGDRHGVKKGLWPSADSPDRLTALSWTTWSYVTVGAVLQRLNMAQSPRVPEELHHAPAAAHAQAEVQRLLHILDERLATRPYLLGEAFSLVDLVLGSSVTYATYCGVSADGHARVKEWLARIQARPSFKEVWGGRG
jgi:GST-like protein